MAWKFLFQEALGFGRGADRWDLIAHEIAAPVFLGLLENEFLEHQVALNRVDSEVAGGDEGRHIPGREIRRRHIVMALQLNVFGDLIHGIAELEALIERHELGVDAQLQLSAQGVGAVDHKGHAGVRDSSKADLQFPASLLGIELENRRLEDLAHTHPRSWRNGSDETALERP